MCRAQERALQALAAIRHLLVAAVKSASPCHDYDVGDSRCRAAAAADWLQQECLQLTPSLHLCRRFSVRATLVDQGHAEAHRLCMRLYLLRERGRRRKPRGCKETQPRSSCRLCASVRNDNASWAQGASICRTKALRRRADKLPSRRVATRRVSPVTHPAGRPTGGGWVRGCGWVGGSARMQPCT